MRRASLLLGLALCACGPDLSAWQGRWIGTAAVNTGRQPELVPGGLVVGDGLGATLTLGPWGTPAATFTCALLASEANGAAATFGAQGACDVAKSAGDACAYELGFTTVTAQREGESLTLDASGRLTTTCPSGGSALDLGVQLSASRR